MKTAIYAGSFDPFTNGHLDILENGAKIFDKIIVLIANNSQKKYVLPVETRVDLVKKSVSHIKNVEVDSTNDLTVNYAKAHNVTTLIRGLRTQADFEYETQMARVNSALDSNINTVFLPATKENDFITSSMIRELLLHKSDISRFVPSFVSDYFTVNYVGQ